MNKVGIFPIVWLPSLFSHNGEGGLSFISFWTGMCAALMVFGALRILFRFFLNGRFYGAGTGSWACAALSLLVGAASLFILISSAGNPAIPLFFSISWTMASISFQLFMGSAIYKAQKGGTAKRKYPLLILFSVLTMGLSFFIPRAFPALTVYTVSVLTGLILGYALFPPRLTGDISPPLTTGAGETPDIQESGEPPEELPEVPEEDAGDAGEEKAPPAPGTLDTISQIITPFIPKEFLSILRKSTIMDLQLGDHVKQEMTIFFSDIRRFTDLSEKLSPEESFKFINSYLSRIVPVISEKGGFVDKYMGDAIMALFPQENGADMAVQAAIEIQRRIVEYNGHRANCGYRPLSMGIGIHTGTLMLGVVGVEGRMQNTVISDAVNLASRLESITKVFNVSLAISDETFKKLEDPGLYMYRFIGKVRVKGKHEPVSVFEIFDGLNDDILRKKMKANIFFEQGMMSYYQKNLPEAIVNFRKVLEILPDDGASVFYLDNCMSKIK